MNQQAQDIDFEEDETQDVDESSGDLEIEIVDDTPEEDRNRPRRAEGVEPDVPDDDEISSYSESVQKRIKKMRWEFHEERRAKEEAARLQEEAIKYAQQIKEENDKLRQSLNENEDVLVTQAKGRLESQISQAKSKMKEAHETGDTDALIEAQEQLTNLQNEKYRVDNYKPKKREPAQEFQPQQLQIKKPPQEALDWADKNPWFGQDKRMTGFAYGVHEEVIANGVDVNSQEYYNQIDAAMRQAFPDKFEVAAEESAPQQRQTGNVVAPTSRTSKKPRKVKLTPTAAALAKRLGLTPEQYAAQLMKDS